jgi:hypothetical protein
MSRFDTIASISRWLSNDTTKSSGWAAGHRAADRVHRQLLHHAIDQRCEHLQLGPPVSIDHVLLQAGRPLLGFIQVVEPSAAVLSSRLGAGRQQWDRRLDLGDRGRNCGALGLLLRQLPVKRS